MKKNTPIISRLRNLFLVLCLMAGLLCSVEACIPWGNGHSGSNTGTSTAPPTGQTTTTESPDVPPHYRSF
ncbi:MAG: hypothetical protein Q4B85_09025 [Lachnospiraceae bacterium]|nr:hypothetical protein [Lachnospiraceae bacterium]